MSQVVYCTEVTFVPSRNFVSRFSQNRVETIPLKREQYSYVYLSDIGTNRALTIR